MALIEIDDLPFLKMVDLSMANWQCHNQMVIFYVLNLPSLFTIWFWEWLLVNSWNNME